MLKINDLVFLWNLFITYLAFILYEHNKRIFQGISTKQEALGLSIISKIQLASNVLNYKQKVLDKRNFHTDFWMQFFTLLAYCWL